MPKTTKDDAKKPQPRSLRDFFIELLRSFQPAAAIYLIGVAILATIALAPAFYVLQDRRLGAQQAYFERALPESLTFEDGTASYDGEQPYMHVEGEPGMRSVLIVDTTGGTTEIGDEYDYGMLITDTTVIQKISLGGRSQRYEEPVPKTEGRISARQYYADQLEQRRWPTFIMLIGQQFMTVGVIVFVLAGLTAVVAYGLEFTQREGRLPISTCFSVSAHAATPVMISTACLPAVLESAGSSALLSYLAFGLPLLLFVLLAARGIQVCRRTRAADDEKASTAT
jgi:hypothetical protein